MIAKRLKARFRIIRLDLPGYGLSDGPTDESLKTLVPTDVPIALLDHLQVRKVTFAGVSSGGTMGMYMAARRPDMIERLILSNTPSDPVDTSHLKLSQGLKSAMDRAQQTGFRDQDFWTNFLTFFAGVPARISAQTQKEYYDFYRRAPEKNLIGLMARIGDGKQATIEMAKVRKPVLLLWGTADPLLPESALNAIGRYLSNAQISRVSMPQLRRTAGAGWSNAPRQSGHGCSRCRDGPSRRCKEPCLMPAQPFTTVSGRAAAMREDNFDTDIIFPARFLLITAKAGLGEYAFHDRRFASDGSKVEGYVLNDPPFADAPVIIAGANFGSGSSREQAVWALLGLGVRTVISSSFGEIFQSNCMRNGIVPIVLPKDRLPR